MRIEVVQNKLWDIWASFREDGSLRDIERMIWEDKLVASGKNSSVSTTIAIYSAATRRRGGENLQKTLVCST